jgi:hypothetical protein
MSNVYREPSIDVSYQVLVHLAKRFQWRVFRNRTIGNKNWLWRSCLLTYQEEMSNLDRGPSINAPYQVSVHLAKRFQRGRSFRNRPMRNKNCLWRPCLLTNRDKMSILYKGPFIDASHQRFTWPGDYRGEHFQKSTNKKHELPVAVMLVNESWRYDQLLQRTFHRCFLPSSFREDFLEID